MGTRAAAGGGRNGKRNVMQCVGKRSVSRYIIENIARNHAPPSGQQVPCAVLSTIRKPVKPYGLHGIAAALLYFLAYWGDQYNRQMHLCSL